MGVSLRNTYAIRVVRIFKIAGTIGHRGRYSFERKGCNVELIFEK